MNVKSSKCEYIGTNISAFGNVQVLKNGPTVPVTFFTFQLDDMNPVPFEVPASQNIGDTELYASSAVTSSQHTLLATTVVNSNKVNCTLWFDYLEYAPFEPSSSAESTSTSSSSNTLTESTTIPASDSSSSIFATGASAATLPAQQTSSRDNNTLRNVLVAVLVPLVCIFLALAVLLLRKRRIGSGPRREHTVEPYMEERTNDDSDGEYPTTHFITLSDTQWTQRFPKGPLRTVTGMESILARSASFLSDPATHSSHEIITANEKCPTSPICSAARRDFYGTLF